MNTPNLLDAIRVVKENERLAVETYANAAKIVNTLGKELFEQLSGFEQFHYERLTALEKSLQESGKFINYEGKAFVLPPRLEITFAETPEHRSLMDIITEAKKFEKHTENVYCDLAEQLEDPQGHDMFCKLSEEEHKHFLILSDAYWSLNQYAVWKYTPSTL